MKPSCLPPEAVLGDPMLDTMHELLFSALARTLDLAADQFPAAYDETVQRMEADFRHEDELMEAFQCADSAQHRAQHARMLAGLHHANAAVMQGNSEPARRALAALIDWLPFHISTQDRHLLLACRNARTAGQPAGGVSCGPA